MARSTIQSETPGSLFADAAEHYARSRPGYHSGFYTLLDNAVAGVDGRPILDLGCGTGQLAIPLAKAGALVTAVDPNGDMLLVGRRFAQQEGALGIRWMVGTDADLQSFPNDAFRACVIGTAFHWMDRCRVFRELDRVIDYFGFIAVVRNCGGTEVWNESTNGWPEIIREVLTGLLGDTRRAGNRSFPGYGEIADAVLAKQSAFASVTEFRFLRTVDFSVEQIIDLQLSSSYATRTILGCHYDRFCAEVRRRLLDAYPAGVFPTEIVTSGCLCTRPSPNFLVGR